MAAWSWFSDHVLGGVIVAVLAGGGHYLLTRRHLSRVTDRQTAHFDEKTDAQTAALGTPPGSPEGQEASDR